MPDLQHARRRIANHQRHHALPTRQRHGIFYTPPALAQTLATAALQPWLHRPRSAPLRILDPAAGAGGLLLEAWALLQTQAPSLYALDIEPDAVHVAQEVLASLQAHAHVATQDALLQPMPSDWPERFDLILANPPFGTINRLGRKHPRQIALAQRFPTIWQDKIERAAFFVARAAELSDRIAVVLPSAMLAADKTRRWRAWMRQHFDLQILDLGEHTPFDRTQIRTALLIAQRSGHPTFTGWRVESAPPDLACERFARNAEAPAGVIACQQVGERWNMVSEQQRARWARIDRGASERLGQRYTVGKGMETGCNAVFELPRAVLEALSEEDWAAAVRRRIRGVEIERGAIGEASRWLAFTPAVKQFDALPAPIRAHLSDHRERLEARAAFRRGDGVWWQYSWPLHRERYAGWRVVLPYRARALTAAVVPPEGGIGLTDTTVIFADTEEHAWALVGWLCSEVVQERFMGLTKHTGGGMMEIFENQVREIPLPAGWNGALRSKLAQRVKARRGEAVEAEVRAAYGL